LLDVTAKQAAMEAYSTGSRTVSVEAKPEPITIDLAMTAALVVDMQNDFAAKGGMFERAGIDISITRAAIAPTARALAAIRQAGIGVIYLKMGFRPDLSDLGPPGSLNRIKHRPGQVGTTVTAPGGRESRILIRDTWNTDILDELKPEAGDAVLYKTRYSGFYGTELDSILKRRGIKSSSRARRPAYASTRRFATRCSETIRAFCWKTAPESPSAVSLREAITKPHF
jgi:nicotinamidase-related amidase